MVAPVKGLSDFNSLSEAHDYEIYKYHAGAKAKLARAKKDEEIASKKALSTAKRQAAASKESKEIDLAEKHLAIIKSGISPKLAKFYAENQKIEEKTGVPGALINQKGLRDLEVAEGGTVLEPAIEPAVPPSPPPAATEGPGDLVSQAEEGFNNAAMFAQEATERNMRSFEALEERQRLAADKVNREIGEAESDLKSYRIDPDRAFGSVGGKVAAAFAMALGAFGQGISGNRMPNTAFDIIQNAIGRDMEAQKAEMMKRKDVLMNKNNVYARMLQRFGNERAAEIATITLGLGAAKIKTEELMERFPHMRNKEVALGAYAKIEAERAKNLAELAKIQGRNLRTGTAKTAMSAKLFENAHKGAQKLLAMWKGLDRGNAMVAGAAGVLGTTAKNIVSSKKDIEYTAQIQNVAQNINKAFSGAKGSDRDLASVLLQIPDQTIFLGLDGREKGIGLIKLLISNLDIARGAGGLIAPNAFANRMVQSGKISEADIDKMLGSDRFAEFKTFIDEGEAQKKSPQ
tara:strand:- start:772 stop:2322 length:1551 start_codon:yes stop_codon:yes gene_type:complete